MIERFRQSRLETFWNTGKHKRVPPGLNNRLLRKLDVLNSAKDSKDLTAPPSDHLHALHGNREAQWAISVNGPWRLCFVFRDG
ncbi:type II toxin-antitoxin system RelE/ParE family toxin [candidate division KSB1 bacterium]|nr:type II toxin-antitoxin system RelE/ParE family toxin [candidate division KSB1 bacterium]